MIDKMQALYNQFTHFLALGFLHMYGQEYEEIYAYSHAQAKLDKSHFMHAQIMHKLYMQ